MIKQLLIELIGPYEIQLTEWFVPVDVPWILACLVLCFVIFMFFKFTSTLLR